MLGGGRGGPTAAAHAVRIATDPAVDAMLASGPAQVSATFNEAFQTGFAAMTVVGPDGNLWSTGDTNVQGAIASVAVRPHRAGRHLHRQLSGHLRRRPRRVRLLAV